MDTLKIWIITIAIILIVIITTPIVINIVYKTEAPIDILISEWDASSMLGYCGGIIGGVLTFIGVFLTIKYSNESYSKDAKNRVLPYITYNILHPPKKYSLENPCNICSDNPEDYSEFKITDYYCNIIDGVATFPAFITNEQKLKYTFPVLAGTQDKNKHADHFYLTLEVENIGNGHAIDLRFGVNKTKCKKQQFLHSITVKANEIIHLHIFADVTSVDSSNIGEYTISFVYYDIYRNRYIQECTMKIEYGTVYPMIYNMPLTPPNLI